MRSVRCPYLCTCLVLLTALMRPSAAHNGAVAIAVPVEGIVVDGDLSDWPEGMPIYPIGWVHPAAYKAEPPQGPDDFQAHFRVGYDPQEDALLLAISVADDENVVHPESPSYDHQDCVRCTYTLTTVVDSTTTRCSTSW